MFENPRIEIKDAEIQGLIAGTRLFLVEQHKLIEKMFEEQGARMIKMAEAALEEREPELWGWRYRTVLDADTILPKRWEGPEIEKTAAILIEKSGGNAVRYWDNFWPDEVVVRNRELRDAYTRIQVAWAMMANGRVTHYDQECCSRLQHSGWIRFKPEENDEPRR